MRSTFNPILNGDCLEGLKYHCGGIGHTIDSLVNPYALQGA